MPRTYRLQKRAEKQQAVREEIIRAAIDLHSMGPTTIGAVAARARVGRATIYRYFPDERALLMACTAQYFAEHPMPDPSALDRIADPVERLRAGLSTLYAYYADNEPILVASEANMAAYPSLAELIEPHVLALAQFQQDLAASWRNGPASSGVVAAIGHAFAFGTWRSLARDQGLSTTDAVELMVTLVERGEHRPASSRCAAGSPCGRGLSPNTLT